MNTIEIGKRLLVIPPEARLIPEKEFSISLRSPYGNLNHFKHQMNLISVMVAYAIIDNLHQMGEHHVLASKSILQTCADNLRS